MVKIHARRDFAYEQRTGPGVGWLALLALPVLALGAVMVFGAANEELVSPVYSTPSFESGVGGGPPPTPSGLGASPSPTPADDVGEFTPDPNYTGK